MWQRERVGRGSSTKPGRTRVLALVGGDFLISRHVQTGILCRVSAAWIWRLPFTAILRTGWEWVELNLCYPLSLPGVHDSNFCLLLLNFLLKKKSSKVKKMIEIAKYGLEPHTRWNLVRSEDKILEWNKTKTDKTLYSLLGAFNDSRMTLEYLKFIAKQNV